MKKLRMRKANEFTTVVDGEKEPLNLTYEVLKGVGLVINDNDIPFPKKLDEKGNVSLTDQTAEYLFLKKKCSKCPKRMLEICDPRTKGFSDYGSDKTVCKKYSSYYDPRGDYYSPSIKRDGDVALPIEITCEKAISFDDMKGERIIDSVDITECNENVPEPYKTGKEYFLAFKRNYEFFMELIKGFNLEPITDEQFDYLDQFSLYKFGTSELEISDAIIGGLVFRNPNTVVVSPGEVGWTKPPIVCDLGERDIVENKLEVASPICNVIEILKQKIEDMNLKDGTYKFSIDKKALLAVSVKSTGNCFKDKADNLSLVVDDAPRDEYSSPAQDDDPDLPFSIRRYHRTSRLAPSDLTYDAKVTIIEFTQICE